MAIGQGQEISAPKQGQKIERPATLNHQMIKARNQQSADRGTESFWLNYGLTMDALTGGSTSALTRAYLSWDSLILGRYGTPPNLSYAPIDIHSIGTILDVYADNFSVIDNINWNQWNSYSVDSMSILYLYERNFPDASVVDTLIVQIYSDVPASNLVNLIRTGSTLLSDYGDDTLRFKTTFYSSLTNTPNVSGVSTIKVLLQASDTAVTSIREKLWASNFPVPPGALVGSTITFKPGYPYSLGDTATNLNVFFFFSFEENGSNNNLGTVPAYQSCANYSNQTCNWNTSQIVPTSIRYNQLPSTNLLRDKYAPTYAFDTEYSLEHHLVLYKVTSTNVGISESQLVEGATLGQNVPNPANGTTTIRYTLEASADIQLDIFDVSGKLVMSLDRAQRSAGSHQVEFDTTNLQEGVYFYTLSVNGSKISRRMLVVNPNK